MRGNRKPGDGIMKADEMTREEALQAIETLEKNAIQPDADGRIQMTVMEEYRKNTWGVKMGDGREIYIAVDTKNAAPLWKTIEADIQALLEKLKAAG